MDLTKEVTAFVISSGEPSTPQCVSALRNQDCTVKVEVIRNVAPMWRAFQQMIDRCKTPFYVQVDADMILRRHAIRTLYENIKSKPKTAQYVAWLWDHDVNRRITGVKIYRHSICKQFPYQESLSCEMTQNEALKVAGYKIDVSPWGTGRSVKTYPDGLQEEVWADKDCLGVHNASQTPLMAFQRWQRLMQKHRALPWMQWLGIYPKLLMEEWQKNPTTINQAKFLGAVAGLVGELPENKEMDSREANQDYRRLAAYVGEYSDGPHEAVLYLTDKCNFNCKFGGTPCKRTLAPQDRPEMRLPVLQQVLDRWPSIKGCCVAGFGEPLMHPDLPGILKELQRRKVSIGLITNGSLLKMKAPMLREFPIGYLSVSLNAVNAEDHFQITGTKTWETVLEGIQAMVKTPVKTGVSFVVNNQNTARIPEMIRFGNELGVKFIHLLNVLPHSGCDDQKFLQDVITPESTESLRVIADAKKMPGAALVEVWPEVVDIKAGPPNKCMSPLMSVGVDYRGFVSGCRRVHPPSDKDGCWSQKNVWHNHYFCNLRATVTGDRVELDSCRGCFGNWKG